MAFFGRSKNRIQNPYKLKDMYELYIQEVDEDSPYYVSWQDYKSICNDMFKEMSRRILEEAAEIQLPFRLGSVYIVKKLPKTWTTKSLRVDFCSTMKYGKTIYHLNDHSNGFKFRFKWNKSKALVKNKSFYVFKATRGNNRELASLIKSGKMDYFED